MKRNWIEIAIALGIVQGAMWSSGKLRQGLVVFAFLWIIGASLRRRREFKSGWKLAISPSLKMLSAAVLICGYLLALALLAGSLRNVGSIPEHFFGYLFKAFAQEWALLIFFFCLFEAIFESAKKSVLAAAISFALCHIPNLFLVLATLFGGIVLCEMFRRHRSLWSIVIAHACIGMTIMMTVPTDITRNMRVGVGYYDYIQKGALIVGAYLWWAVTTTTLVLLLGTIVAVLSSPKLRSKVRGLLQRRFAVLLLPLELFAIYFLYAIFTGGIQQNWWRVALWLFAPYVVLWVAKVEEARPSWWDAVALVFVGLPFDMMLLGDRATLTGFRRPLDWAMLALCATLSSLVIWPVYRNFENSRLSWSFSRRDAAEMFKNILMFGIPAVALGMALGFLPWQGAKGHSVGRVGWLLFLDLMKMLPVVALWEEMFFRGVILNILCRVFRKENCALAISAILFGLWHLPRNPPGVLAGIDPLYFKLAYVLIAGIAGLAYGRVYLRTRSIVWPVCMHGIFDAVMHTFFR